MRRKSNRLFISYAFSTKESSGFGHTTSFQTNKKKLSYNDLLKIIEAIKNENSFREVTILNYQYT